MIKKITFLLFLLTFTPMAFASSVCELSVYGGAGSRYACDGGASVELFKGPMEASSMTTKSLKYFTDRGYEIVALTYDKDGDPKYLLIKKN